MKLKVIAALLAAVALAAGLVIHDQSASAYQTHSLLAKKRAGDCTLYGSGCLGDWTQYSHGVDGDPATADVLVMGDSIVNYCRPYLRLRLAPYGLSVVFDYWSSRPTAPTVDRLLSYTRIHQPDTFAAVAMLTGTNDIFDPTVMTAQINRARAIESPLIWGTVYASRPNTLTADLRNSGWVNNQIASSGLPISDWFAFLAAKPTRTTAYLDDGVHPDRPPTPPATGDGSGCDAWAAYHAPRIAAVAG